jgi:flagellar protein FlgJ
MTTAIGGPAPVRSSSPADSAAAAQDAKLRKVSVQLEGVFVQQMYKSMRSTVPTGGLADGGSGEELFTSLMDDHIAADTPQKWKHGLSESIFRQLRDAVRAQGAPITPQSSIMTPTGVDK